MNIEIVSDAGVDNIFSVPRIGVHMELNSNYTNIIYNGKGPDENYSDRKRANHDGIWNLNVDTNGHSPYVVPSENGGRCDVKAFILKTNNPTKNFKNIMITYEQLDDDDDDNNEEDLSGLFIHKGGHSGRVRKRPADTNGAQINLSRYNINELNNARHDDELIGRKSGDSNNNIGCKDKTLHLHVDTAHMGVGGDTGWTPETHYQYRILAKKGTVWRYSLKVEVNDE